MKRFIFSILCVSVFFIGLGGIAKQVGAGFKSDERALALIRQARIAIGGDANIAAVRSLTAKGNAVHTFNFDGTNTTQTGDYEINLALPNQFSKMMKLKLENISGDGTKQTINEQHKVVIIKKGDNKVFNSDDKDAALKNKVVIVKNGNGEIETEDVRPANDGNNRVVKEMLVVKGDGENHQQNEMFRTMLALLLTAPPETDFTYAGEGDVDGNACDIVEVRNGNSSVKLSLDKSSHLPRMMSYQGHKPMIFKIKKDEMKSETDTKVFAGKMDKSETAEFQIRFSDYRAVNGVLLPHHWAQAVGGNADETVDITGYEINPANISEKFQNLPPKVLIRTEKKPQ